MAHEHEFPEFTHADRDREVGHLKDRVRELEEINELLLDYIEIDLDAPWRPAAERLAAKLRAARSHSSVR
jgi:hypothetical protein